MMNVIGRDYVALDIETTGLNPDKDEIIEIGAVRYQNGTPIESYSALIKPSFPLSVSNARSEKAKVQTPIKPVTVKEVKVAAKTNPEPVVKTNVTRYLSGSGIKAIFSNAGRCKLGGGLLHCSSVR